MPEEIRIEPEERFGITVCPRGNGLWIAFLEQAPLTLAYGITPFDALGHLLLSAQETLDLNVNVETRNIERMRFTLPQQEGR